MTDHRDHFATVEEAVEEIRNGRMIVLVDDEDRENEGDLTMAAEKITSDAINFMAKFGRDLIRARMRHERYVRRFADTVLTTRFGDFRMIAYSSDVDHDQHVALVRGELEGDTPALVRVHSHCLTGDVFGSTSCDCKDLVERSLEAIAKENRGVLLYLHHTGRGFCIDQADET